MEADGYYKLITKWNKGADGLADVLNDVQKALAGVRKGTGELKEAIGEALDSVE